MYGNGQGVKQDYQKAIEYYQKAASMGSAHAYYNLGAMYFNGEGVWKNLQRAEGYLKKACELGLKKACDTSRYF
ncbi:tetratricopeptide repeat protein [Helicobacter suis]|uniref:tetratricopeptide repeat protein n=1 Tax=Helicobacter suis TaxID=104628 RepID=UPI001F07374C|nr:tetratricopeptide repeat protein [Helicobacter suis]